MSYMNNINSFEKQDLVCEPTAEQELFHRLTSLEFIAHLKESGQLLDTSKPRRPRQSPAAVSAILEAGEAALATITALEIEAGPTATAKLGASKRFQSEFARAEEIKGVCWRLLGQRNALFRVLGVQLGVDVIRRTDAKVEAFLEIILDLSANVAALSGSNWKAVETYIGRNLPALFDAVALGRVKLDFERKVVRAAKVLAAGGDLRTAPTVTHIAHELGITLAHLRTAGANRVGLTSIDRVDRKTRQRNRSEQKRRAAGAVPMAERTLCADTKALAARIGCNEKTIRRHRSAGTLDQFLAGKSQNVQNPSLAKEIYVETNFGHSENLEQTIDLNDVFVFHEGERNLSDAVGPVPELPVSRPCEEEACQSQPPVRSCDG